MAGEGECGNPPRLGFRAPAGAGATYLDQWIIEDAPASPPPKRSPPPPKRSPPPPPKRSPPPPKRSPPPVPTPPSPRPPPPSPPPSPPPPSPPTPPPPPQEPVSLAGLGPLLQVTTLHHLHTVCSALRLRRRLTAVARRLCTSCGQASKNAGTSRVSRLPRQLPPLVAPCLCLQMWIPAGTGAINITDGNVTSISSGFDPQAYGPLFAAGNDNDGKGAVYFR